MYVGGGTNQKHYQGKDKWVNSLGMGAFSGDDLCWSL